MSRESDLTRDDVHHQHNGIAHRVAPYQMVNVSCQNFISSVGTTDDDELRYIHPNRHRFNGSQAHDDGCVCMRVFVCPRRSKRRHPLSAASKAVTGLHRTNGGTYRGQRCKITTMMTMGKVPKVARTDSSCFIGSLFSGFACADDVLHLEEGIQDQQGST